MNTANFAGWLEAMPETKRFLVISGLVFGPLLVAQYTAYARPARTIAVMVLGVIAMYRLPVLIARAKPPVVRGGGRTPGPYPGS